MDDDFPNNTVDEANDDSVAQRLAEKAGAPFCRLFYDGDVSVYASESDADYGMLCDIARECGPDPAVLDRLYRMSALYRRPGRADKWDARHSADGKTYGEMTIAKVVTTTGERPDEGQRRQHTSNGGTTLRLIRASEVESTPIRWLLRGRIPRDELTLFDGDGGIGKTSVAMTIIADVSSLLPLPDDSQRGPWNCIILAEENRRGDLKELLRAAGADLTKIFFAPVVQWTGGGEGTFRMPDHIPQLRDAIRKVNAQLVYIDSLFNHFGTRDGKPLNPNQTTDVRFALSPLVELAHEGVTIIATRHWTKAPQGAKHRGFGSADVTNIARSVLSFAPHPSNEGTFVFAVAKPGLSQVVDALTYSIESASVCDAEGSPIVDEEGYQWTVPRIRWLGTERIRADSLFNGNSPNRRRVRRRNER